MNIPLLFRFFIGFFRLFSQPESLRSLSGTPFALIVC
jgi:hypothetical protein